MKWGSARNRPHVSWQEGAPLLAMPVQVAALQKIARAMLTVAIAASIGAYVTAAWLQPMAEQVAGVIFSWWL